MTPFGAPKPAENAQGAAEQGERWEARTLTIIDGEEAKTGKGKVYWRVKDSENRWYSVWEAAVKIRLETAADNGEAVKCAVQITPGRDGGRPFYTIAGTDNAVDTLVQQGSAKAVASRAPGGRNSEFGKRMHPDDALRVTNLACQERAIQMVALTIADKPEAITYEQYVKAKLVEYTNFLSSLINQPLTPTPQTPEPLPPSNEGEPPVDEDDPDIPF